MLKTYEIFDESSPVMVSIICNAFNHEKYISQCLESMLNQEVSFNVEILVHDDASTDNTRKILENYVSKYPAIIKPLYESENQHNKGAKITRDIQIPRAKGKYVAFLEGDDYWCDKNKLEKAINFLESNNTVSATIHDTIIYNCKENKILRKKHYYCKNRWAKPSDLIRNRFHISSIVARKECLDLSRTAFEPLYSIHVGDLQLKLCCLDAGKIYYFHEFSSFYRLYSSQSSWTSKNSNSITQKKNIQAMISCFDLLILNGSKYKKNFIREKKRLLNLLYSSPRFYEKISKALLLFKRKILKENEKK